MGDLPDAVLREGRGYAGSISSRPPPPRVLSCCLKAKLAFALSCTPSRPNPAPTGRVSAACRATLGGDAGESSPPLPLPVPWLHEPYRFVSHSLTKWSRLCLGGCVSAPPASSTSFRLLRFGSWRGCFPPPLSLSPPFLWRSSLLWQTLLRRAKRFLHSSWLLPEPSGPGPGQPLLVVPRALPSRLRNPGGCATRHPRHCACSDDIGHFAPFRSSADRPRNSRGLLIFA